MLSDLSNLKSRALKTYFKEVNRTSRTKLSIITMLILKVISIGISFLIVPLTLHYLDTTNYGIWLTINSIITWFTFFDIGLGNGLRNKFAEAIALKNYKTARIYVSTTYAFLIMIVGTVYVFFLFINPFLGWAKILNVPSSVSENLNLLVLITFSFFCLKFIFGLIGTILIADQKPALSSALEVFSNLLSLILIWLLIITTKSSLIMFSVAVGFSTAFIPIVASLWLFNRKYKDFKPSIEYIKFSQAGALVNLGVKFFLLQIVGIIIFSTSNIIITQLFSPADVVTYNIAFKYYSIISMGFSIILTPFWSAYTEAYINKDFNWIRRTIIALKKFWTITAIIVIIMSLFAEDFYRYWIGKEIHIPIEISISMGIYVLIIAWCNIYANFINGTGKIQLQLISAVIIGIVNIPLAIFLAKSLQLGIVGVILAPSICILPGCLLWPIQVRKILTGTAKGIWAK